MKSNYKRLGDFIQQVKLKNTEGKYNLLLGINIDKYFMPSVANIIGTDLTNYKLVKKDQFACNRMHVGRDYRIPIALSDKNEPFIVSPAYTVFEIINKSELLPEYLMMWFSRKEFDRNAWFHTDADVRGGLPWELFCELELPVPLHRKAAGGIKEYNTIVNRIKLNEQLNQKLEETAQAIYKHWFVDFEFPDKNGLPYKSSGGDMVWNEKLGKEVPAVWEVKSLVETSTIKGGKRLPKGESLTATPTDHPYIKVADMGGDKFVSINESFEFVDENIYNSISCYTVNEGDVILSIVGTIGQVRIIDSTLNQANLTENCVKITTIKEINNDFLYHYFKSFKGKNEIEMKTVGGVQGKLPIYNIESFQFPIPKQKIINDFSITLSAINFKIINIVQEQVLLLKLKFIILSKMSKS